MECMKRWCWVPLLLLSLMLGNNTAASEIPTTLVDWWRQHAPLCHTSDGWGFPGKQDEKGACDDGDDVLFAGLLCAAGEALGCEAVKRAQESSGRWFRSARRRETSNDGTPNSFSPDMALGTQLYVTTSENKSAYQLWLDWIDRSRPCIIGTGDHCVRSLLARFCTDDTEKGCTIRPTDAAVLGQTSEHFDAWPPTSDVANTLRQANTNVALMVWLDSQFNKPGYSQHLVATEIFLLTRLGVTDDRLLTAAVALSSKQPRNPFFRFLAKGSPHDVATLAMAQCPTPESGVPAARTEWMWEREDSDDEARERSMLWECIFIADLLGH